MELERTLTIEGQDYKVRALTVDEIEAIWDTQDTPRIQTKKLAAASLGIQYEEIGKTPFKLYSLLVDAALEVNGLKASSSGESQAKAVAATA